MLNIKLIRLIKIITNGQQWLFRESLNLVNLAVTVLFLNIVIKFGILNLFQFLIQALHLIKESEALRIFQILIKFNEIFIIKKFRI